MDARVALMDSWGKREYLEWGGGRVGWGERHREYTNMKERARELA